MRQIIRRQANPWLTILKILCFPFFPFPFFPPYTVLLFCVLASSLASAADTPKEENWRKNPNLVAGDFERGGDTAPKGWEKVAGQQREPLGGLVRWTAEEGNPSNKVIRFTLDRSVAEGTGTMYYSADFPVEENATYRFQCRWRSDGPAAKVFIKCYNDQSDHRREVYRSQQNLNGPKNAWNTHTEDFTPKHARYAPKWGRVMFYAYLTPGAVEFDDVVLKQVVPASPGEQKTMRRPSSETKITIQEMEENYRRSQEAKEKPRP
jgi:hypothetical protein